MSFIFAQDQPAYIVKPKQMCAFRFKLVFESVLNHMKLSCAVCCLQGPSERAEHKHKRPQERHSDCGFELV